MKKINNKIKRKIIEYLPLIVLFFIVGFLFGTYYQQIVFIEGAGKILSYTDIQINFNETKFVQEINNTFLPEWKKNLNESIQKLCLKTQKGFCAKECYENGNRIPCEEFTGDEHFCYEGICQMNGVCPDYFDRLNNKTIEDCINGTR